MFRFCVLTAVSTPEQARGDKDSLDYQYKVARAYGERMGGAFVKLYQADGYTRSDYYDLSRAFAEIPELDKLATDATKKQFDVILLESFDRLGDIGKMLMHFLKPYRIQLRSVQQALPIDDPKIYDPGRDDSTAMMLGMSGTVNTYRIHKIVRAFAVGNPARARAGKFSIHVPYGYIKVDKNTAKVDPHIAALFVQFPGWLLSGCTINEIVHRANASGVPTKTGVPWCYKIIKYILQNPFYAGKTFHGRGYMDPIKHYTIMNESYEVYDGNHEAIWTWEQFQAMQTEIQRRRRTHYQRRDYNLTSLLLCETCGETLKISYNKESPRKYWRCDQRGHVSIPADRANVLVAAELKRMFLELDNVPVTDEQETAQDYSKRELVAVRRNIANLDARMDAYEPADFIERRRKLLAREAELLDADKQKAEALRREGERQAAVRTLHEIANDLEAWIVGAPPSVVKFHLSRVARFTVSLERKVTGTLL